MPVTPLGALGEGSGEHLDQLDTLRAFAVTAVLIRHFWPELQPGLDLGARGVHLFFVLSGFLITGILLRSRALVENSGRGSGLAIRRFYIRRFLRIFPIYYLVLAVTWAFGIPDVRSGIVGFGVRLQHSFRDRESVDPDDLTSLVLERRRTVLPDLATPDVADPAPPPPNGDRGLRTHRPASDWLDTSVDSTRSPCRLSYRLPSTVSVWAPAGMGLHHAGGCLRSTDDNWIVRPSGPFLWCW